MRGKDSRPRGQARAEGLGWAPGAVLGSQQEASWRVGAQATGGPGEPGWEAATGRVLKRLMGPG